MIHPIPAIPMHEHHFRDEFTGCFRERLSPDDRCRVGAAEDGDGGAGGEKAFFRLVLPADAFKVIRRDDGLQPSGEVADMPGVIAVRGGVHQIAHDRFGNRQNLLFAQLFEVHSVSVLYELIA